MVAPFRGIPCLCSSDAAPFPFLCPPDESAGYRQNLRGWRFCPPFGGQSLPNRLSTSGWNAYKWAACPLDLTREDDLWQTTWRPRRR